MVPSPQVSIIIPVFNGSDFIRKSIESCYNQNLSVSKIEVIVVDDASTDNTSEIIADLQKEFHILYHKFKNNKGVAAARNHGIKMAQGDLIAFLDVDDLMKNDKLTVQLDYFKKHPAVDMLITAVDHINHEGLLYRTHLTNYPENMADQIKQVFVGKISSFTSTIIFKRSIIKKIGLMNENLRYLEDHEFLLRAVSNACVHYLANPLTARRLINSGLSFSLSIPKFIATRKKFEQICLAQMPQLSDYSAEFWSESFFGIGRLYQKTNNLSKARHYFLKSLKLNFNLTGLIGLFLSFLPIRLLKKLEQRRWKTYSSSQKAAS